MLVFRDYCVLNFSRFFAAAIAGNVPVVVRVDNNQLALVNTAAQNAAKQDGLNGQQALLSGFTQ